MVEKSSLRGGGYDPIKKLRDAVAYVSPLLSFFPEL
jgi:hypothetical protein